MEKHETVSTYPELLSELLQRHVGHGRGMSMEHLAEAVPCKTGTLYAIRAGDLTPSADLFMRIVAKLPDEAQAEFFAAMGLFGVARIEGTGSLHEVHYEVARTVAYYGEAYADGLLDHVEQRNIVTKFLPSLMAAAARCTGRAVR